MRVLTKVECDDLVADHLASLEVMLDTGVITYATHPLEKMFGYNLPGELEGELVEKLIPESLRERHSKEHRPQFSSDPSPRMMGRNMPLHGRRKDGSSFPVEVLLLPRASNRVRVVVAFVFDMSGRSQFVSLDTQIQASPSRAK